MSSRTGMGFVVAEVAPGRYFTLSESRSPRYDPQKGTIRIREAVQFADFIHSSAVMRQIEGLCANHNVRVPNILRLVAMECIITKSIYESKLCESPAPESSAPDTEPIESSSIQTFRVEHTLSPTLKTLFSVLLEEQRKTISRRTSRRSRSSKRSK